MKITPIEIRQKTFEKNFRGYDKDEVNAFLLSLSQEWERMIDEYKVIRIKLEASEKEVSKLREVENSLFKTLKTAEDTGANLIEQANKSAELHMKETQMNADALMNEAKHKAKALIEESEQNVRSATVQLDDEVKNMHSYIKSLESYRGNLMSDIRIAAKEALDKVKRMDTKEMNSPMDRISQNVKWEVSSNNEGIKMASGDNSFSGVEKKEENQWKEPVQEADKKNGSFFDQID